MMSSVDDCLTRQDVGQLQQIILSEYQARVLGGRQIPAGDFIEIASYIFAGASYLVSGDVQRVFSQLFIDSMCDDVVLTLGDSLGLSLNPPSNAWGWAAITGTIGTSIASNLQFTGIGADGVTNVTFTMDSTKAQPLTIGADGTAQLQVLADAAGANSNLPPNAQLTLSSAVSGINSVGSTTADGINGGADVETVTQLRARLKLRRRTAIAAGNLAWYQTIAGTYAGVTRFCAQGCDCADCCSGPLLTAYPFLDNVYSTSFGVPPQAVCKDIQDYIWGSPMGKGTGKAPVGAYGQLLCAAPASLVVSVPSIHSINPLRSGLINAAIRDYFLSVPCVGQIICTNDIVGVINATVPGLCFGSVTLRGAASDITQIEAGARYKLGCGKFPILQSVGFGG